MKHLIAILLSSVVACAGQTNFQDMLNGVQNTSVGGIGHTNGALTVPGSITASGIPFGTAVGNQAMGTNSQGQVVMFTPSGGGGSGNASTNNAAAQIWSGVQSLTNTANKVAGDGGGLTNNTYGIICAPVNQTAAVFVPGNNYYSIGGTVTAATGDIKAVGTPLPFACTITNGSVSVYNGAATALGSGTNIYAYLQMNGVNQTGWFCTLQGINTFSLMLTTNFTGSFAYPGGTNLLCMVLSNTAATSTASLRFGYTIGYIH